MNLRVPQNSTKFLTSSGLFAAQDGLSPWS